MKIFGKEYGMFLTVGAAAKLAEMCPGGELSRFAELIAVDDQAEAVKNIAEVSVIMNAGYREYMKFAEPETECNMITRELIKVLPYGDLRHVGDCIMEAVGNGMSRSVIAEPINIDPNEVVEE